MQNKSLSVARSAVFSTVVFGKHAYNILFLRTLALSLDSGRAKLEQVQAQIDTSQRQHAGQAELFLVINRLEEFAAAVNDR
ncbi:MAG: hypothetical protein AADX96_24815, partial [Thiocapsa sp. C3-sup]